MVSFGLSFSLADIFKLTHEGPAMRTLGRAGNERPAQEPAPFSPSLSKAPPIVHEVIRSPGRPLDRATRVFMEPRFGHDFSQVRIHADAKAAESARAVNALAYTVGQEVVFAAGQYEPGTRTGQRLLAHELTHVVQQNGAAYGNPVIQRQQPPGPAAPTAPAGERRHVVQAGETLSEIAWAEYRDIRMADAIARANGITDPNRIVVGESLVLPPAPASLSAAPPTGVVLTTAGTSRLVHPLHYTYVVAPGDSLSEIVRAEYGDASYVSLVAHRNAIPAPNYPIIAGATLALPPVVIPAHPTHVVASGEGLSTIARDEYGDVELWPTVARALGLAAPFTVRGGATLTLPPVATRGANLPHVPAAAAAQPSQPPRMSPTTPQAGTTGSPDAGRPPQTPDASAVPTRARDAGSPDAGRPPQAPAAAPTARQAPTPEHPSSRLTTPGAGATARQQAAAEWARYRSIQNHFRNPRATPEEAFERYVTLRPKYQNMGIANPAEYITRNIRTTWFFGRHAETHAVHMQPLLTRAEQNLRARGIVPTIRSIEGLVPRDIRGSSRLSNHATGHAVDLDSGTNPLLRDPQGATSRVIAAAAGTEISHQPRVHQGNVSINTPASIEEIRRAGVRFGQVFSPAWVARQRARLLALRRQSSLSREALAERTELERLVAAIDLLTARAQLRPRPLGNIDELTGAAHTGFISLSTELIVALRDVGFRWGGDYNESPDFMHFELDGWT